MKRKLTEQKLKQLYRLLSVRMTDFDCGKRCAPQNNGVPYCCDREKVIPVLFKDEYQWHRLQGVFWGKMPVQTKSDRKLVEESCSYNVFAVCPGVQSCRRTARSLTCRLFPFEPFIDSKGYVKGLVYQSGDKGSCSLMEKPQHMYNQMYIRNATRVWQELVDTFPEDKDLYIRESRKRTRHAARMDTSVRFFYVDK
jgi:hypothetical protein